MNTLIQKIVAKIFNSKLVFNNPYINFESIENNLKGIRSNKCIEQVLIGENSKFYYQAEVVNLQNEKEKIIIGNNSHIRGTLLIFKHAGSIHIGDNSYIGFGTQIWSADEIIIGNDVLISHNCNIIDTNSHEINYVERMKSFVEMIKNGHSDKNSTIESARIVIEDNVWISFNVSILKGVTIGKGAIIAAGSVVTKDVPPFTIVAGNPSTVIRNIS